MRSHACQSDPALVGKRTKGLFGLAENRRDRDVLGNEGELARFQLHRVEKILDEAVHLLARPPGDVEYLRSSRRIEIFFLQQLGSSHNEAERIAEVVRDDPEDVLARVREKLRMAAFLQLGIVASGAVQRGRRGLRQKQGESAISCSKSARFPEVKSHRAYCLAGMDERGGKVRLHVSQLRKSLNRSCVPFAELGG